MTDKTATETTNEGRRGFLKLAAVAPVAAAATGAATEAAAETGPQSGLADTAQTRAYYASARF